MKFKKTKTLIPTLIQQKHNQRDIFKEAQHKKFIFQSLQMILRLVQYATVSTETSVFIIGGYEYSPFVNNRKSSIMEYNNNVWNHVGNLHTARHRHIAIALGSMVMIIGGSDNTAQTQT